MRNALVKKMIITCCILFTLFTNTFGQYRELLIDPMSQQTGAWCWAACMEMIMNFHKTPNTNQCGIVKKYRDLKGFGPTVTACCTSCPSPGVPACSGLANFHSLGIKFSTLASLEGSLEPDYIDQIFSLNGFSSMQEINTATAPLIWDLNKIKEQIKACRPFIIFVTPAGVVGANLPANDHALVVKGYNEINDITKYIITNDPWKPCTLGNETILPYTVFTDANTQYTTPNGTYFLNRVAAIVHTIYPNVPNHKKCLSCQELIGAYDGEEFVVTDEPEEEFLIPRTTTSLRISSSNPSIGLDDIKQGPIAAFTATPKSGLAPLTVYFDAAASTGNIIKYNYNFGNGNTAPQAKVAHTFDLPGNYPVTLTVVDNEDASNTDTIIIQVLTKSPPDSPRLIDILVQNSDKIIAFNNNVLKKTEYQTRIQQGGYHDAPVLYLSFDKLNRPPSQALKRLSSAIVPNQEVIELVTTSVQPNIVTSFQKINKDSLALRSITTYTSLREKISVVIQGAPTQQGAVVLSNLPDNIAPQGAIKYQLVKCPPFPYEFYSFQLKRANSAKIDTYLVPVEDYPDLDLRGGVAYTERNTLQALTQFTRIYAEQNGIPSN